MTEIEAQRVVDTIGQGTGPITTEECELLLETMETVGLIARIDDPNGGHLNVITEKGKQYTQ